MVLGRARVAGGGALAALILALVGTGCGAESHPNEPRPAVPTRVSVTIGANGGITVQPQAIGMGPEKHQQLPQNQNHPQPRINTQAPLSVVFVTANQTGDTEKVTIRGPKQATSKAISPRAPGTFSASLPTGSYTISAAGQGAPATLKVGPYRTSSQNDLLLP
ncbi:MAG: hypothetical protein J0H06_03360 [Actinobacteria bacterium]|nr:hypothetical protein [Actinomycetota bacterium]OJU86207.1 MAG: hypothetical protein BGO11_18810 [Solirubrobacterales bacterium 70-9]